MRSILWLGLGLIATPASAHKPFFSDGQYGTSDQAWTIENPDISIVLYHNVTCEQPVLWLRYEVDEPTEVFVQLGVPLIDRLAQYEPALGVVHEQASQDESTPFAIPDGMGLERLAVSGERELFFEPFTQTQSWILIERKVAVPAGVGYLAAWSPTGETGKLWVAVGETEQFGSDDWANAPNWLGDARFFHEAGSGPAVDPVEQVCGAETPAGCSATAAPGWWLFLGAWALRRRRQGATSGER